MDHLLIPKRPEIPQSAVILKSKYTVLHRSDLLMKEHKRNVKNMQKALRVSLNHLEQARTKSEVEKWTMAAADLKEKAEQMVLILQVMNKLNTELSYARSDLNDALYKGVGDINAARKRVIWLEDKMGKLCGKRKIKSHLINQADEEYNSFPDNENRHVLDRTERLHIADEKVTVKEPLEQNGCEVIKSTEKSSFTSWHEEDQAKGHLLQEFGRNPENSEDTEFADDDAKLETVIHHPESFGGSFEEQISLGADYVQEKDIGKRGKDGEQEENRDDASSAFITELEDASQTNEENVDTEITSKQNQENSDQHQEAALLYWQSEHHRFEYSDFSSSLSEVDPLSYNRVGLAVPDSFLKRSNTDFTELPWKMRLKSSDIKDIHREALDKLALRVYNMQDKICDAAMLSVLYRPPPDEGLPKASFLQNLDKTQNEQNLPPEMTPKSKSMPLVSTSQQAERKTPTRIPRMERLAVRTPVRLVFHPKPISPPKLLPLTRTNLNKEFPPFASTFANPDPGQRPPAERIADQRNLAEETRLVLYRQKPKPNTPKHISMERRFYKMIEYDRMQSPKTSAPKLSAEQSFRKKVLSQVKKTAATTVPSTWSLIKPQSRGKEYSGLRWERVKSVVHESLISPRVEERIDAAKQLGTLRCGDTMVFYALKECLHQDADQRVRYEAAKSLVLLGCWEDEVMQVVLKYLVLGNTEIRLDLINTLTDGKNVQFVDKSIPTFVELVKVLSHFCRNPDPDDQIAFDAAVLLGRFCIHDGNAEARLIKALEESNDTHTKAKALEILVRQFGHVNAMIIGQILQQLKNSPVWHYRVSGSRLLIALGPNHKFVKDKMVEIYNVLKQKLWDDPNSEVRLSAAKALTALGIFTKACEEAEAHLEDGDENLRAEAVVSVGTLGLKNERVIRLLLEMLELDSSEFVRLMIIRTFATLKMVDRRILRTLREREKLEGPLGRESQKALKVLDNVLLTSSSRSASSKSLSLNSLSSKKTSAISPMPG